jgi:hypothetical protein
VFGVLKGIRHIQIIVLARRQLICLQANRRISHCSEQ